MEMQLCVRLGLALLLMLPFPLFAQNQQDSLSATILREDASFWDAYNRCDIEKMSQFFWPDVEFYHDKAGPTIGRSPLVETLRKNLCGNSNFRLRREAIADTVKVFPLEKNGAIYGAVLSGEHLEDGAGGQLRPPCGALRNTRTEVTLPPTVLVQYVGKYDAPKTGTLVVARNNNLLTLTIGNKEYVLHPESESVFFTIDRDLTFEFVKEGTKVSKLVVREHAAIVEEAKAE